MGRQLPDKLVDLLREMRAGGVSIRGLQEATGLAKDTIIRYTSPETLPERKWSHEAEDLLRQLYPTGCLLEDITVGVNAMGVDVDVAAVRVRIGQLKLRRQGQRREPQVNAKKEYWRKWREQKTIQKTSQSCNSAAET